jgi:hypothetical protein
MVQTAVFYDNEHGDESTALQILQGRVIPAANLELSRLGAVMHVTKLEVCHKQHHLLHVFLGGEAPVVRFTCNVYASTKRQVIQDRKAEEGGEEVTRAAPRRGKVAVQRKPSRRPAVYISADMIGDC